MYSVILICFDNWSICGNLKLPKLMTTIFIFLNQKFAISPFLLNQTNSHQIWLPEQKMKEMRKWCVSLPACLQGCHANRNIGTKVVSLIIIPPKSWLRTWLMVGLCQCAKLCSVGTDVNYSNFGKYERNIIIKLFLTNR